MPPLQPGGAAHCPAQHPPPCQEGDWNPADVTNTAPPKLHPVMGRVYQAGLFHDPQESHGQVACEGKASSFPMFQAKIAGMASSIHAEVPGAWSPVQSPRK